MTLHVQDDEVTFNVFKAMKYPNDTNMCFQVNIIDKLTVETFKEHPKLSLESCIIHSDSTTEANKKRRECMNYQEATTQVSDARRTKFEELGNSSFTLAPSIKEPPKLELKQLPSYEGYAYVDNK